MNLNGKKYDASDINDNENDDYDYSIYLKDRCYQSEYVRMEINEVLQLDPAITEEFFIEEDEEEKRKCRRRKNKKRKRQLNFKYLMSRRPSSLNNKSETWNIY